MSSSIVAKIGDVNEVPENEVVNSSPSFRAPDVIKKKRDGDKLSREELEWFIRKAISGEVEGYQLGAMLMSIFLKGMSIEETVNLTDVFIKSGDVFSWPEQWGPIVADKHSTGGVGDKVSLPLAPALSACGLKVPMVSGRGLGFTGGTLDKLESIPGFMVSMSWPDIKQLVSDVGCCIVGQTDALVPADKLFYAVRDVTATVESTPLIAASIISKKAAENLSCLVLDTKYGKGAFIKDYNDAKALAQVLVDVSTGVGVRTRALLTRMDDPLGYHVGNSLEVYESLQCLRGQGPSDLNELVVALGGHLLEMSGLAPSLAEGSERILASLNNGSAMDTFRRMLLGQGVPDDIATVLCDLKSDEDTYERQAWKILPRAKYQHNLRTSAAGYVCGIDALTVAEVCGALGAGRVKAGASVDLAVGVKLLIAVGDWIEADTDWVEVHHSDVKLPLTLTERLESALQLSDEPVSPDRTKRVTEIVA